MYSAPRRMAVTKAPPSTLPLSEAVIAPSGEANRSLIHASNRTSSCAGESLSTRWKTAGVVRPSLYASSMSTIAFWPNSFSIISQTSEAW